MAIIVPAILEKNKHDFDQIVQGVLKLHGLERIQVDFADGKFVPNVLISPADVDSLNPAFIWEAHLMCQDPMDFLDFQISGFNKIIVHYEAYSSLENLLKAIKTIRSLNIEPAVCLKNDTKIEVLKDLVPMVKHFQLMSIVPGVQGNPFIENTYERIKELRQLIPHAIIQVDGGVNESNIKLVKQAGADLISVGSALVKSSNISQSYENLLKQIQ